MQNKILLGVISSLRTRGFVKANDVIILGIVNQYLNEHVSRESLLIELSPFIMDGYFEVADPYIRVTGLGIEALRINQG